MKNKLFLVLSLVLLVVLAACSPVDMNGNNKTEETKDKYTEFNTTEKASMASIVGEVIPFLSNNEYTVVFTADGFKMDVNGETEEEFEAYVETLKDAGYVEQTGSSSIQGDVVVVLKKGNVLIEAAYSSFSYKDSKIEVINLVVKVVSDDVSSDTNTPSINEGTQGGNNGNVETDNQGGDNGGNQGGNTGNYQYTDFTSAEKQLFTT